MQGWAEAARPARGQPQSPGARWASSAQVGLYGGTEKAGLEVGNDSIWEETLLKTITRRVHAEKEREPRAQDIIAYALGFSVLRLPKQSNEGVPHSND